MSPITPKTSPIARSGPRAGAWLIWIAASAGALVLPFHGAQAGPGEPQIIPGVGPHAVAAPQAARPGAYGGGFIEFLATSGGRRAVRPSSGALTAASFAPPPGAAQSYGPPPTPAYGRGAGYGPPPTAAYASGDPGYGAPPTAAHAYRRVDYGPRPTPAYGAQTAVRLAYGASGAVQPQGAPVEVAPRLAPDPRFARQEVAYGGPHKPGSVVVDTPNKHLYLVQPGGRAIRYGIGVGRPGFEWSGVKHVSRKAEWPDWRPPPEMLKRRPDLPTFMAGGPDNPLGARALYLGSSLYRIHGTNEPHTIGQNVSSGCIRMMNDDVIDLYGRVPVGATVVVI